MERDKNTNLRHYDEDDVRHWPDSDAAERNAVSGQKEDTNAKEDTDISGNDLTEEERDRVRHHQAFGNKHYESFKNHSSADDQPMTDTGA